MRLVTDGERYGIRKGIWPFYSYLGLDSGEYWWSKTEYVNKYCFDSDKEHVMRIMYDLNIKKRIRVVRDE